jgi:hypothetical protein
MDVDWFLVTTLPAAFHLFVFLGVSIGSLYGVYTRFLGV